jgi:predicted ATPase
MICLVEALNFRCLKYIHQELDSFHVLVGPNASGKTTFLDTISFLGQLISNGLEAAVSERTQNFQDLLWGRSGDKFELAIEAAIPAEFTEREGVKDYDRVRYEISLGTEQTELAILLRKCF